MMRITALIAAAALSAVAGYCLGFRQAWNLALMAEAPVRGAIAVSQLHALDKGQPNDLRAQLESEVDAGLVWWAQVERFSLHRALNHLSGESVLPDNLRYVRRVASYRKQHASPFADPKLIAQVIESVRAHDPRIADQMEEVGGQNDAAMALMIEKYAE